MRDRITAAGLPEDQVAQVLMAIDLEMSDAPEGGTDSEGKALSKSGASATSSRSPKSSASARGSNESG